jgi:hypothetical protein
MYSSPPFAVVLVVVPPDETFSSPSRLRVVPMVVPLE